MPEISTDTLATALCAAGFWEWCAGAAPPDFAAFQRFVAIKRADARLCRLAREPSIRSLFAEMVRLEFEARAASGG